MRRVLSHVVDFHEDALAELAGLDKRERVALAHSREKLVSLGERLPFPHQSAVAGSNQLRELRPRAGRSPWRAIYAKVRAGFVIVAIAPEAQVNRRGFDKAVRVAHERLVEIGEDRDDQQDGGIRRRGPSSGA